ncbi:hypothetical protein ACFE04_002673 [Oxalis oulophora]
MVLLVERFSKLYTKLENMHHNDEEALSASLQRFQIHVSNIVTELSSNTTSSEFLSLAYVHLCLQMFDLINKAFAKFVVEINYPMISWELQPIDEFLNCSLNFLELLNSVSSEISYLKQARLPLAYALSLLENQPSLAVQNLKNIEVRKFSHEFNEKVTKSEDNSGSEMERVVLEALMEVKGFGFWLFGVVLAFLSGDAKAYLDMKIFSDKMENCLGLKVEKAISEKGFALKEIKEVNFAVNSLASVASTGKKGSEAAEDLRKRLEGYEKTLDTLGVEIDRLFAVILAGRNELMATIRQKE